MSNGPENFRNSQISGKKDNLKKLTEIFEMIFRRFSVPFDFEPEFSEILVEWNAPLVFESFLFKMFSVPTKTKKPAFSNSFEKVRFRDGLVWTVQIKLRFQISAALCGRGQNLCKTSQC